MLSSFMPSAALRPGLIGVLFLLLSVPAHSAELNNNELEFTGVVSSLVVNGEGVGTIFLRIGDVDARVIINHETEITDDTGDSIEMSALNVLDVLKVRGKFSPGALVASEVSVLKSGDQTFRLRGVITSVQSAGGNVQISLAGVNIIVPPGATIESEGAALSAGELRNGMIVEVRGTVSAGVWTATTIHVDSEQGRKVHLRFEGIVRSVTAQLLTVEADGTTSGLVTVHIDSNTEISGVLAVGVLVSVDGILNADFSVNALKIRVLSALEIKPDSRKMRVGETASFTVKLRETAAANVTVTLTSASPDVASVSVTEVVIAAGKKTADFDVKALKVGSAEITAAALGQKATARITVGEVSDENTGSASPGIFFAPDHMTMGFNETREVVLGIRPPQHADVPVVFAVNNDIVTVGGSRTLSNGTASLKVAIQSGSKAGVASVVATLPASLGGGKAELLVTVSAERESPSRTTLAFKPSELQLAPGDSRTVTLQVKEPLAQAVTISVSGAGAVVDAPASVVLAAGSRQVDVKVTAKAVGEAVLTATLPASAGGASAKLKVEVKNRR